MALLLLNNAESQVSGTTVTTANQGVGGNTLLDQAVIGANMTMTNDSAHPAHGVNGFKFALTSTATAITTLGWTSSVWGAAVSRVFGAFYVFTPATVTSSVRLVQFYNGTTVQMGIGMTNGLQGFQFRNSTDTAVAPLTGTLTGNTLYRVEFDITFSTAAGAGTLNVYLGDSLTVQGTSSVTAQAFGASGAANGVRYGLNTAAFSATSGDSITIDDLNINDSGMPGPGPYGAVSTAIYLPTFQPWIPKLSQFTQMGLPKLAFPQPQAPPGTAVPQTFFQTMTATVTGSSSFQKQPQKLLTATSTITATIQRQINKLLTATATGTAFLTKTVVHAMSATLSTSPTLSKTALKSLTVTSTASASTQKTVQKPLTASLTTSASLAVLKVAQVFLTATATVSVSMVKLVNKSFNLTVTLTPSFQKLVLKYLTIGRGGATYRAAVLADNPLLYVRLDETSGPTAVDSGSAAQNGTYIGSGIVFGVQNSSMGDGDTAVTLNGSTNYVNHGNNSVFDLTGPMTIEAWINPNSLGANNRVLAKDGAYGFGINTTRALKFTTFGIKDYLATGLPLVTTGVWQHVAAVFDANQDVTFYLNGAQGATIAGTLNPNISVNPVLVGMRSTGLLEPFSGSLDDVALYPTALDASRIQAHYNAAAGMTFPVVTTTATLNAIRSVLMALTATVTLTASMTKQTLKNLTSTVTATASLSTLRTVSKALTATVITTASFSRKTLKSLTVSIAPTAVLLKKRFMTLTASVTTSASLTTSFVARGTVTTVKRIGNIIIGRF